MNTADTRSAPTPVPSAPAATGTAPVAASEILLTPDGRILAHHLTPELAAVLHSISDPAQPVVAESMIPPPPHSAAP